MIIYNGKNSLTDFDLYPASKEIPVPTRKTVTETVPYMSGLWDFSFHDGDVDEYEALKIKYTFDVIADTKEELNAEKAVLIAWAHSRGNQKLYDTDISTTAYYEVYHAQASWSENDLQGLLTVEFTCYPFIKTEKKTTIELTAENQTITIENEGSRVVTPTIKVASKNLAQNYFVSDNATQYIACLYVEADLKPNTVYTISFVGASGHNIYLNENLFVETGLYSLTGERQSITVTTKNDISTEKNNMYLSGYGWLIVKNRSGNTITPSFSNVQIEEGHLLTDYVPFIEANATINDGVTSYALGAGTFNVPLALEKGTNIITAKGEGLLYVAYSEEAF